MKAISIQPIQKPIKSELTIPGSKSYTNRGLLLAALTNKSVKIVSPLVSGDTRALIGCLKNLGIKVSENDKAILIEGNISSIKHREYRLNAHLSGTTIRFILALATIIPGTKILFGDDSLNKRPIGDLVDGLRQLGAKIEYLEKENFPPVKVLSSKLTPGIIKIKGTVSSQYVSAILMIAPLVGEVTIKIIGKQISKPYIGMTIDTIDKFGVTVSNKDYRKYLVPEGQKYETLEYPVEGDYSSAAYFFAIAALTKSIITIKNLNTDSLQADKRFLNILEKMGNKIIYRKDKVTIEGKGVKPVDVDMEDCPDQIQTLAVLAAFAKGITKISGAQSLRVKETNRILALKKELGKMGIPVTSSQTVLIIHGGNPKPACIQTYGDHRMAMAFAIAGSKLAGMKIIDPDVVSKTFPAFWKKLNSVGIKTKVINRNIVLIGMRGSGKSTVAKLLAKRMDKQYLELDELIVKRNKLAIPEMVKKHGWSYFREKESEIVQAVSFERGKIISTGGGVVIRKENIYVLKENGMLVFLNASLATLFKRIGNHSKRPALTEEKNLKEEMKEILKQRELLYKMAADEIINTDRLNPKEVADRIIARI